MRFVLLAISLLTAPWQSIVGQEQRYQFEAHVEVVAIDVAVIHDGRPVSDLTAEDFEVRDNGILQEVDRVQVETAAINAILILDISESVSGDKLVELRAAVRDFVAGLREIDRAALMAFSRCAWLLPYTRHDMRILTMSCGF